MFAVRLAVSRETVYIFISQDKSIDDRIERAPRSSLCGSRCGEYAPRCSTVLADRAHERGGISLTQTSKPCGTRFGLDIRIQIVHTVRLTVYATPGRFRWRKRAARPGARLRSRGRTSLAARLGQWPHRTAPRCQLRRAGGGRDGRARLIN